MIINRLLVKVFKKKSIFRGSVMLVDIIKKGLVLGLCFGFVACSDSDDDDDSNGINAILEVTVSDAGTGTNVKALMLTGSEGSADTTVVNITSGNLEALANGTGELSQIMGIVDNGIGKRDTYEADFISESLTTEFEVKYVSAPSSTVSLPMGFDFTGPTAFNWTDTNLDVVWLNDAAYPDAGVATFTIFYQITCPNATNEPVITLSDVTYDALTSLAIPMATIEAGLVFGTVNTATDSCDVEIELHRSIAGSLDANYANGSITGIQTRTETYTINP